MTGSNATRLMGGAGVLALAGLVVACGRDGESSTRSEREAVALARATPPAQAEPARLEPPVESTGADSGGVTAASLPATVSYGDAERVYHARRYAEAADLFGVYIASQPSNPWGHYMLGLASWKAGDLERADEALRRSIELDSTNVKARTNLGRVLLEQGRPADALTQLHAALELAPDASEIWRVIGNAHGDLGRGEDALVSYREALVHRADDAWSMNNYGLMLIRMGRFDDAVPALARAVELAPGSALFQNNLGAALERTGDLAGARAAYAAAVDADATHVRAAASLARVTARVDDSALPTTDLPTLARAFVSEIERWSSGQMEIVVR